MGQVIVPRSGLVYVDTSVLIYRIENIEPYLTISLPLWNAMEEEQIEIITSELTYLEALVKPTQLQNMALIVLYKKILLNTIGFSCCPITMPILEKAISLRATLGLKTPDSIHAATAILNKCEMLVTNDPGFKRITELNVIVLKEFL